MFTLSIYFFIFALVMRYKITLSYNGAGFCGWQVQPDAPSVQGCIQNALATLLHAEIKLTGAGRTDTGVNASHYVAHFDSDTPVECAETRYKLNAILPSGIAIKSIEPAGDDFHARFSATGREYTYFLHRYKDPFAEKFSWLYQFPDVDFEAMNLAARHLLGTHDFKCFEKTGADNKTSICTVTEAGWFKEDEDHWYFRIAADRFLRNMVRAIVGTLLEVGRGRRSPESIAELIENGTRCDAGQSVPGHALFLSKVKY